MRKIMFLAMLIACCASVSMAQEKSKTEVFAGFSVDSIDTGLSNAGFTGAGNRETGYGFDTSVTGYLNDKVGIEGNVDGHFKTKTFNGASCLAIGCPPSNFDIKIRTFNFMAGPHVRFATSNSSVTPFVHGLVGANHSRVSTGFTSSNISDSETDFALKLGGGVDFGLSRRVDLRLGADYNPVFEKNDNTLTGTSGGHHTRHDAVFSVGLVFK